MAQIKNKEKTGEDTSQGDPRLLELDILSELVEEYENAHFPVKTPSLASVILSRMHEMHLSQKEPTFQQAIAERLGIDADIVPA